MAGRLTELQRRVLALLAPVRPAWTLTGGAALAEWHLQHRTTRDLDLFWHGLRTFDREPADCIRTLLDAGLRVEVSQRSPAFVQLRVADSDEQVMVDLVAEPVARSSPPQSVTTTGGPILIDSAQEILANKLGALLHRAELRDLIDIRGLLAKGLDLDTALRHAAQKDLGFSPLIVAHLLHGFPVERLAVSAGISPTDAAELASFARRLETDIATRAKP